nr:immunoglobulin heavy chain junction region [Mus musculus]MBK4197867.1 immunoglobulin heavy chain junction region [Mus musculus]
CARGGNYDAMDYW